MITPEMFKSKLFQQFLSQGFWHAHHVDLVWRMDGKDIHEEADWLKTVWYALRGKKFPKNEADAPRGQAVAFDELQTTILAEAIRIGVPLKVREAQSITERVMERYFAPPPSPVGEADGVHAPMILPMPMILSCLHCGEQHIDEGEWATRLHRTHKCAHCGGEWRPTNFYTVGVKELPR